MSRHKLYQMLIFILIANLLIFLFLGISTKIKLKESVVAHIVFSKYSVVPEVSHFCHGMHIAS